MATALGDAHPRSLHGFDLPLPDRHLFFGHVGHNICRSSGAHETGSSLSARKVLRVPSPQGGLSNVQGDFLRYGRFTTRQEGLEWAGVD